MMKMITGIKAVVAAVLVAGWVSAVTGEELVEDFEQEAIGGHPTNWTGGKVTVSVEKREDGSGNALKVENGYAYYKKFDWGEVHKDSSRQYEITMDFCIDKIGDAAHGWDGLGICLVSRNFTDGCLVNIRKDKTVRIKRMNSNTILKTAGFVAQEKTWYRIKIELNEKTIGVSIDDKSYINMEHDFPMRGRLAVGFPKNVPGLVDNIRIVQGTRI